MEQNKYEKRAKDTPSALSKALDLLNFSKTKVIVGIIFSVIGTLCMLAAPLVLKQVSVIILNFTSGATKEMDTDAILVYSLVTIGLFFVGSFFQYIQVHLVCGVIALSNESLREKILAKINHLPLNYFDTRNIGDVLSYISNDVDVVGTTLNQTLSTAISSLVTIFGSVVILFVLNWKIGLVALLLIPVILMILSKVTGTSEKYFQERSDKTRKISSEAEEAYTAFNIVRVFNAKTKFRNKFAVSNYQLEKSMAKADYYSGLGIPMTTFLGNVLFSAIALVGGIIVCGVSQSERSETIAMVIAAVSYGEQLISPITSIATTVATFQQTIASMKKIMEFLEQENEPDESDKTVTLHDIKGNIEFRHVRFGYTKDRIIVHDFCEKGLPGQKIAIVGPTGAGKTTMVNLLMRFYELNSGEITIEGVDTKTMNRSYVRSLFGMVLQDTWLFEGTIMENLKYSRPEASDEEVYAACKATHCDTFIRQQPNGYQTLLNEECGLSSGQKQLLTIARAMIQNAPMLILDEATSSVDTRTELMIQDAMDALMKGRTSFVIAHRLSTIKNSDLIIVMKDGDVIETGNHQQLMDKNGFYAGLYNAQFTGNGPQFS